MVRHIYLDHNATTPLDPKVFKAMLKDLSSLPLNPSSIHFFGQQGKALLTSARSDVASYFNAKPEEIIFTSGGTESLNMAIRGIIGHSFKGHIITTSIEHSCIHNTVDFFKNSGMEVTFLPVSSYGTCTPEQVKDAIRPDTKLIVLSAVNGETGVKTDFESIADIALENQIPFVVDGVALLSKEIFDIPEGVSAMCFSGHKIHGPKGVGLTVLSSDIKISPLITGGPQEFERRAGTENLPGILGLAEAINILKEVLPEATHKMQDLRDHLELGLRENLDGVTINGEGPRVVNTTNLVFDGIDGETLLIHLDQAGIAASHGSACASGALEPSRVLINMGLDSKLAKSSVRFSISPFTTKEEIDQTIHIVSEIVKKLRKV